MSYTARETIRNIVFVPGKTEISALLSKGLAKDNPDHCDGCHLRVRPLDGNLLSKGSCDLRASTPTNHLLTK